MCKTTFCYGQFYELQPLHMEGDFCKISNKRNSTPVLIFVRFTLHLFCRLFVNQILFVRMGYSLMGKYMMGKSPPISGQNGDGYKSRWRFFLMGKKRWVNLHDGYKSMVSIPWWAFVFEKMCDGQISDGEYPGNRSYVIRTYLRKGKN